MTFIYAAPMAGAGSRLISYQVDAAAPLRLTMCGIRGPQVAFVQARRQMPDFVAFLVVKGEIELSDEMPDGIDRVVARPGEVHVVGPGIWQASTQPFPAGIVFLWFHFSLGRFTALDAPASDAAVRQLHRPVEARVPQDHWLIPRQLDFGDELESVARAHTRLVENDRLWGLDDRGTQAIAAELVYRMHRAFVHSRLRGREITRTTPEVAHVARAREFIRLNHERPISLRGVAKAVALNPEHLSRCFRRVTGRTVGEAILAARIETAKRLLLEGYSAKETAFLAGFASASYFCRLFRRATRATPLGYVIAAGSGRARRR